MERLLKDSKKLKFSSRPHINTTLALKSSTLRRSKELQLILIEYFTNTNSRHSDFVDKVQSTAKVAQSLLLRLSNASRTTQFKASSHLITNQFGLCLEMSSDPALTRKCISTLLCNYLLNYDFRIPLAAGMFNREVYIEGIKHRLDNSLTENSSACSIQ